MSQYAHNIQYRTSEHNPDIAQIELCTKSEKPIAFKRLGRYLAAIRAQGLKLQDAAPIPIVEHRQPEALEFGKLKPFMLLQIKRLSNSTLNTTTIDQYAETGDAMLRLTEKKAASAIKGEHFDAIIEAVEYLWAQDVRFVTVEFLGDTTRGLRGLSRCGNFMAWIETNRNQLKVKGWKQILNAAFANAMSVQKPSVAGIAIQAGDRVRQPKKGGKLFHDERAARIEQKKAYSSLNTFSKAQLVSREQILAEMYLPVPTLIEHDLDEQLIEYLKNTSTDGVCPNGCC